MLTGDGPATALSSTWPPIGGEDTRDEIILRHLVQVKLIAKQINERLPVSVGLDDLVSAGILGLIAAVDRYDPSQRVKLKTYAEYKIRGAILDSLRTIDWAPRQQRRRGKLIESAMSSLQQKLQRRPTEAEVAAELRMPVEQYQDWLATVSNLRLNSLDAGTVAARERNSLELVADESSHSPSQLAEQAELEDVLAKAIEVLPAVEKTVLSLYYYEEMTLREIARILSLHESRISQLKTQAIQRLRSTLAELDQSSRSGTGDRFSVSSL